MFNTFLQTKKYKENENIYKYKFHIFILDQLAKVSCLLNYYAKQFA